MHDVILTAALCCGMSVCRLYSCKGSDLAGWIVRPISNSSMCINGIFTLIKTGTTCILTIICFHVTKDGPCLQIQCGGQYLLLNTACFHQESELQFLHAYYLLVAISITIINHKFYRLYIVYSWC